MTPADKRQTWRRITMEDKAWRFNTYAERAREAVSKDLPEASAGPLPDAAG